MIETSFTPLASLFGGILIGLSAVMTALFYGRIMGVSGLVSRLLPPRASGWNQQWTLAFIVGVVVAPLIWQLTTGSGVTAQFVSSTPVLLIGAFFVGLGSVLGNGCTSGHGVCGLSRLSLRSLGATLTFMAVAFGTAALVRLVFGGFI